MKPLVFCAIIVALWTHQTSQNHRNFPPFRHPELDSCVINKTNNINGGLCRFSMNVVMCYVSYFCSELKKSNVNNDTTIYMSTTITGKVEFFAPNFKICPIRHSEKPCDERGIHPCTLNEDEPGSDDCRFPFHTVEDSAYDSALKEVDPKLLKLAKLQMYFTTMKPEIAALFIVP